MGPCCTTYSETQVGVSNLVAEMRDAKLVDWCKLLTNNVVVILASARSWEQRELSLTT